MTAGSRRRLEDISVPHLTRMARRRLFKYTCFNDEGKEALAAETKATCCGDPLFVDDLDGMGTQCLALLPVGVQAGALNMSAFTTMPAECSTTAPGGSPPSCVSDCTAPQNCTALAAMRTGSGCAADCSAADFQAQYGPVKMQLGCYPPACTDHMAEKMFGGCPTQLAGPAEGTPGSAASAMAVSTAAALAAIAGAALQ